MSDILTADEVTGLRKDLNLLMGIDADGDDLARTVVSIYRPATERTFDETTLQYSATDTLVYNGPAIIGPMVFRRDRQETIGAESRRMRVYRCIVPYDAGTEDDEGIEVDNYLIVEECDDPEFADRRLEVTDVMYESELAARRLTLTDVTRDTGG